MRRSQLIFLYAASLPAAVAVFLLIRSAGLKLLTPQLAIAPTASPTSHIPAVSGLPTSDTPDVLLHVLVALAVIVAAARLLAALFRRLHQPPVMGEIVAGMLLGPSLLGWLAPQAYGQLLPANIAPYLSLIAQIGIILFMFLVGLELDTSLLRQRTRASIAISHASIVAPFLLGAALALWIYPRFAGSGYAGAGVSFTPFALFIGVAMSVTAFPVLARILTDSNLQRTRLGALALACAAVDDVTAWCLLALVVGVAHAEPGRVIFTVGATAAFAAFMLLFVRKVVLWLVHRQVRSGKTTQPQTSQPMFTAVCVALLLSALATEGIGIHALFGAFLLGAIIPHDSVLAYDIREKCEDLVIVLFLPVFFAFTGMRTQVGLLNTSTDWLVCAAIILVATLGKFGGSFVAARLTGSGTREAASLGILMNTRGLMELVVLNVGLDLGVLSPTLFAMFVLMALATTLATSPILRVIAKHPSEGTTSVH